MSLFFNNIPSDSLIQHKLLNERSYKEIRVIYELNSLSNIFTERQSLTKIALRSIIYKENLKTWLTRDNWHTWPTRILIRVLRSRLSLCSLILICTLIISANVKGLLVVRVGTVNEIPGLLWLYVCPSYPYVCPENELPGPPPELWEGLPPIEDLLDGILFWLLNPNALFILLCVTIPTPVPRDGEPGEPRQPDPLLILSPLLSLCE